MHAQKPTHACTYRHAHTHACTHTHTPTHRNTHACMHKNPHMHARTPTYAGTHTHVHAHAQSITALYGPAVHWTALPADGWACVHLAGRCRGLLCDRWLGPGESLPTWWRSSSAPPPAHLKERAGGGVSNEDTGQPEDCWEMHFDKKMPITIIHYLFIISTLCRYLRQKI